MELKFLKMRIKKFDFNRTVKNQNTIKNNDEKEKKLTLTIKISTSVSKIEKKDNNFGIIDAKIIFKIVEFADFNFEIELLSKSSNFDEIIEFWKNDKEQNLPKDLMANLSNRIYYFSMPIILLFSEKAGLPPVIPPLSSLSIAPKKKRSIKK
jgi:hypothetical protein